MIIDNILFKSKDELFVTRQGDYVLITNVRMNDENKKLIPLKIKPLLKRRWLYSLNTLNGSLSHPPISKQLLNRSVKKGQIIAYNHAECTVNYESCVYFGILPSMSNIINDNAGYHTKCKLKLTRTWPRKMYVYVKLLSSGKWKCHLSDNSWGEFALCDVPWHKLYVMLGEYVTTPVKCAKTAEKKRRDCDVCNQCIKCNKSVSFCRQHKKCHHQIHTTVAIRARTRIKDCARYQ